MEEGTGIDKVAIRGKGVNMCCNEASTWVRDIVRSGILLTRCKTVKVDHSVEWVELGGAKLVHLRGYLGGLNT